jgi:hypothetical protein
VWLTQFEVELKVQLKITIHSIAVGSNQNRESWFIRISKAE